MADPITFTDDENSGRVLIVGAEIPRSQLDALRYATPDDLARAGYYEVAVDQDAAVAQEKLYGELGALRALEEHARKPIISGHWYTELEALLNAIDGARK